jgi:hypothetical protein
MTDASPTFGTPDYEVNLLHIAGVLALPRDGPGACSVTQRLKGPQTGWECLHILDDARTGVSRRKAWYQIDNPPANGVPGD